MTSIFQSYLNALKEKYPYRIMEKDPYILYWRTQSNKEYMVSGYDFGNYVIGEDSKSFDIFFNGEKETIVIYKTRGDR